MLENHSFIHSLEERFQHLLCCALLPSNHSHNYLSIARSHRLQAEAGHGFTATPRRPAWHGLRMRPGEGQGRDRRGARSATVTTIGIRTICCNNMIKCPEYMFPSVKNDEISLKIWQQQRKTLRKSQRSTLIVLSQGFLICFPLSRQRVPEQSLFLTLMRKLNAVNRCLRKLWNTRAGSGGWSGVRPFPPQGKTHPPLSARAAPRPGRPKPRATSPLLATS